MPKDFKGVMKEWGQGELHSGSKQGPLVKNQKQAEAIAYSEQKKLSGKLSHAEAHHHLSHAHDHLQQALEHIGGSGY